MTPTERGFDVMDYRVSNHFGVCPLCRRTDGFLNVGRDHWFVCHAHRVKWFVGSNLFSGWRDEGELSWRRNQHQLATYQDITD